MPRLTLHSLLLAALVVLGSAGAASAEEGYRYWNYHHLVGGEWEFSQVGPSGYDAEDGDVEGYRYGASAMSDKDGVPPRADLDEVDFEAVCGAEDASADQKRVAVVIDYGAAADADGAAPPAPRAECAVVAADANGQQVLDAVADVRAQDGLTCALDGYPAQGCGEPVPDVQETTGEQPVAFELPGEDAETDDAADAADDEGSGLLWPLVGAAILVVIIGTAAFLLSRRNRTA